MNENNAILALLILLSVQHTYTEISHEHWHLNTLNDENINNDNND